MKNKIAKIALSVICATSLILTNMATASASANVHSLTSAGKSTKQQNQLQIIKNAPEHSLELTGKQRLSALDKVTQDLLTNQLILATSVQQLKFDDAVVLKLEKHNQIFTTIVIPVKDFSPISNFTIVYEENGTISNYAETLYFEGENGNLWMSQWINGNFTHSKDIGFKFIDNDSMQSEMQRLKKMADETAATFTKQRSVGKIAACLAAVTGIGGIAAVAIATACIGACAFPEPTASKVICAACIGGYATLGAGGMTAVVGCFQL